MEQASLSSAIDMGRDLVSSSVEFEIDVPEVVINIHQIYRLGMDTLVSHIFLCIIKHFVLRSKE